MTDRSADDPVGGAAAHGTVEPVSGSSSRPWPLIGAVVVTLALVGAAWTLASPIGAAPNDDFHLASIWCGPLAPDDVCDDLGWSFDANKTFVEVPAEIGPVWCFVGDGDVSARCAVEGIEHGTVVRSIADDGLYPGLYHAVLGVVVTDQPVASALAARAASWGWSMALLAAGWAVLPRRRRGELLAVLLVTAVPHGVFLWASTNPSGVVVAGVLAAWCATVATAASGDRRARLVATGVLVVATASAAGGRADGGLFCAIAIAAALALTVEPASRASLRRSAGPAAVAAVALAVSAVVLARRLGGPSGLTTQLNDPPPGAWWTNVVELPWYVTGNLGRAGLGWLDTPMPRIVWVAMVFAFAAVVARGLGRLDRAKTSALSIVLIGLVALPYYLLWRSGVTIPIDVQARFVLPLLPVLGVTALYRRRETGLGGLNALQVGAVVGLVVVAHSIALHTQLRRYVSGLDVRSPDLDAEREWWWSLPIGPNAVWIVGSLAFLAGAVLVAGRLVEPVDRPDDTVGAEAHDDARELEPVGAGA